MPANSFEGPPTALQMDAALSDLLSRNRLAQARDLAVAMTDYWTDRAVRAAYRAAGDPYSLQEQFYFWLGARSVLGMMRAGRRST